MWPLFTPPPLSNNGYISFSYSSPSPHYFVYRVQLVSDLDEYSKVDGKNEYKAFLKTGELVSTLKKSNEEEPINANRLDSYKYSIEVYTPP